MKAGRRIANWIIPAILIAGVVLVTIPLVRPGFFVSDDGGWMIIRLSAFYQSFRDGQFPVRFLGRLNFGYGYPVANFLYPGFMYIGSIIHIFGFSFVNTVKIILGGSVLVGTIFTYLWLKKYFDTLASSIGALGFTLAPYLLFDVYHRGSVGEILALAAAAMGLYSIAAKKRWLFGLSLPVLILAHNTLALLFIGFYVVYITLLGFWPEFWLMFGTGIGMGAFFWLPALYEQKYVVFNTITVSDPRQYFITLQNGMLLGFSGIIAAVVALFRKKFLVREKTFFLLCFALTIVMVLPVSLFIWQWPLLVHIIQFPYRILSLTVLIGAWLTAYAIQESDIKIRTILVVVFLALGIWGAVSAITSVAYLNEPEGFYTTNEATTTVADEYMPKWVVVKPTAHAPDRIEFYKGRGTIQEHAVNSETLDVVVAAQEDSVIQINTMYYPGWGATVDDVQAHIDYVNDHDLMRIAVPAGSHHLVVAFRETISRFLADCLSLASLIAYIVFIVIGKKKKQKQKKK